MVPRPDREIETHGDTPCTRTQSTSSASSATTQPSTPATTAASPPLSLATKSSYKDKKCGEYVSHTEWHNCVVFGKLATFAGSLKKGAHVEIDGALRSREYVSKKTNATTRVWEIKVKSILKLDRAEQAAADEAEFDETEEFATEDVAA